MKTIEEVVELLNGATVETTVEITGKQKTFKAIARCTSVNLMPDEYYKVVFQDHSIMVVIPSAEEVYFAERVIETAENIPDEMVGAAEKVNYNGKDFELVNKDDYQFCLELQLGNPLEVEGECSFSDYEYSDDNGKELLSLGWISYTRERADTYIKQIPLEQIN